MPTFPAERHTLPNGLTLLLSPNPAEPRIYTQVVVRAGSKHDPDGSTGLAHYLEHMLFKGTDRLGSADWAAEEPLLQEIARAYEQHRATENPVERRVLYREIDELSQRAAEYALPGEYDRIIAQMGARGTNAYTWVDQTVFLNDIPANELSRWMDLESERFSRLVLRLFHTELETVYEEFNISQDKDVRKVMRAANESLFAPHPYGTHTVIGKGEHLKAPSHFDIYEFFKSHYVPGNMAVVLAGDFDPRAALALAGKTFGTWESRPVPVFQAPTPAPTQAVTREVFGQEAPSVMLHWRVPSAADPASAIAKVTTGMLFNQQAGLFDQELLQAQRLLSASASLTEMTEHSMIRCVAQPRPGQSLEEARELLLAQVERLRTGDVPSWLLPAVVVDHELAMQRSAQSNQSRAGMLTSSFVHRVELDTALNLTARLRAVTLEQVRAYAKTHLRPADCVTVYKRQGEDTDVLKVEKPEITPVPLNTDRFSGFAERLLTEDPRAIEARFSDLGALVSQTPIRPGLDLHHLPNAENQLFELLYIFDFGTRADRLLQLATSYLAYLGTPTLAHADVQVAFYRLGLEWQIHATGHRVYVGVSGLDGKLPDGLELLDTLLRDCQPDAERWAKLVDDVEQKRRNQRSNKQIVLRKAMNQFGRYGEDSPMAGQPSVSELRATSPADVVARIHKLADTQHTAFYYGPRSVEKVVKLLEQKHPTSETPRLPLSTPDFSLRLPREDEVQFVDFPMVQVEVLALRHVRAGFDPHLWMLGEWFNQYYGLGLSSVVFQELRESRALAYSTYAYAEAPQRAIDDHYLQAFIGTQPDKLTEALTALGGLLRDWRWNASSAAQVRQGILQQMRTERDLRQSQYWLWRQGLDRGVPAANPRRWLYEAITEAKTEDLEQAFRAFEGAPTRYLVLGERSRIDFKELGRFGKVRELSLDEVFGFNLK